MTLRLLRWRHYHYCYGYARNVALRRTTLPVASTSVATASPVVECYAQKVPAAFGCHTMVVGARTSIATRQARFAGWYTSTLHVLRCCLLYYCYTVLFHQESARNVGCRLACGVKRATTPLFDARWRVDTPTLDIVITARMKHYRNTRATFGDWY